MFQFIERVQFKKQVSHEVKDTQIEVNQQNQMYPSGNAESNFATFNRKTVLSVKQIAESIKPFVGIQA